MVYTHQVFGVSSSISDFSYVDRDNLDKKLLRLLNRETHIAIKGPSKCGKSWLRKRCMENAITVQCRLGMNTLDIYRLALSSIDVRFDVQKASTNSVSIEAEGKGKLKIPLISEAELGGTISANHENNTEVGVDFSTSINNLEFITRSIIQSGKRLVIEDFHYLDSTVRQQFAHDLKTFWDYNCFIVIIGIWTQTNLLTYMNPDLTGRIEELSISWTNKDLELVINHGCNALNIEIDQTITKDLIADSFGNVGILQSLLLRLVEDEADISCSADHCQVIAKPEYYVNAAKSYAEQLDGLYQQFAQTLSVGIRRRKNSTGIYALAMQAIVNASDKELVEGFSRAAIFDATHEIEPRIQKGNLKTVLKMLVKLQNPQAGHDLVISYDESIDAVFAIDLQLLFYRKHHTLKWPWEEMAEEARQLSLFEPESEANEII